MPVGYWDEDVLLGGLLVGLSQRPDAVGPAVDALEAGHFRLETNRLAFASIVALRRAGGSVDLATVFDRMCSTHGGRPAGGASRMVYLWEIGCDPAEVPTRAAALARAARDRTGRPAAERYGLERGGAALGTVAREEWDGEPGTWSDRGRLEPAPGADTPLGLLVAACRLDDEVMRSDPDADGYAPLTAEAARLRAEFMAPGVVLVSLTNGSRTTLRALHIEAGCVFWW